MSFNLIVLAKCNWYCYLRVHEAERKAHGDGEKPHEDNLEGDSPPGFIASELHWVPQAEVAVHADGAQVHYGGCAEQYVQTDPCQTVDGRQREEACHIRRHFWDRGAV